MNGVRASKIQYPRLVSYCAPIIIALVILIGGVSYQLPAQLKMISLILPLPLGIVLGAILYFRFGHEVVNYDEKGFQVMRGTRITKSFDWGQFTEVSLFADAKGGVNVRLYYQPEGEYVEVPGTKAGVDVFSLRNSLTGKLRKT